MTEKNAFLIFWCALKRVFIFEKTHFSCGKKRIIFRSKMRFFFQSKMRFLVKPNFEGVVIPRLMELLKTL